MRDGLPLLDPVNTWLSLAGMLSHHDLVAVADHLIADAPRRPHLATLDELHVELEHRSGARHLRALRRALEDARPGAWSRPETHTRLLVSAAGIPEPVLNLPIDLDGRDAVLDLAWPRYRVALEYDGRWHQDAAQRLRDMDRHERAVDAGWDLIHVRAADVYARPASLIARVLRRLSARGYSHDGVVDWTKMPRFEP